MGYRLCILGISTAESIIKTHHFYGTNLYGYVYNEDLFSFKYLIDIRKLEPDTYFNYSSENKIYLTKREFIAFILLYNYDLQSDKEVKHEYNLLEDKDIKELMNYDYNIYEISWG